MIKKFEQFVNENNGNITYKFIGKDWIWDSVKRRLNWFKNHYGEGSLLGIKGLNIIDDEKKFELSDKTPIDRIFSFDFIDEHIRKITDNEILSSRY